MATRSRSRGKETAGYLAAVFLFIQALVISSTTATAAPPTTADADLVLNRYRELICAGGPPALTSVRQWARALSSEGAWPDIDYADRNPAFWSPANHLARVRAMALALATQTLSPSRTTELRQAIDRALDRWITHHYQCPNWWWNEIGVPRYLRDIVVLLRNDLSRERRDALVRILGEQVRVRGTGANLVWTAELALHHGCLVRDRDEVAAAARRIWDEVKVGAGEGIQPDGSFYPHGPRLQTFHYAKAYLGVVCQLAWELRDTPWAMPEDKRAIISRYILGGPQWMCRGVYTVPGTMDRQVSRKGSLRAADLRSILRWWIEVDPDHRDEIRAFIARQEGRGKPLLGFRHFPYGDFTVYHRPAASVFLKTVSRRTRFSESINGENLQGVPYLNCGDYYIVRDGQEYHELQPVWQWNHLPGLTTAAGNLLQQRTAFVGGLGDGQSGLAAMDYVRANQAGARLALRKSWFFHGDVVLCLLSPIEAKGIDGPVVSSLEQCRLRGPVQARTADGELVEVAAGERTMTNVRWLLHHGVGYMPLAPARLKVFAGERTGSWRSIHRSYADTPVRDRVFQVLLEHDAESAAHGSGWALLLDATDVKLDALLAKPTWRVLRNDRDCQAVEFPGGLRMASFFAAGSLEGRLPLTVDRPCLAIWSKDALWLADPTFQGGHVMVRWAGRRQTVELPAARAAVQVRQSGR